MTHCRYYCTAAHRQTRVTNTQTYTHTHTLKTMEYSDLLGMLYSKVLSALSRCLAVKWMHPPQHMYSSPQPKTHNTLCSGEQFFLDVQLFTRGCVCPCRAAHIVCEVEKEAISGEMCLEEHAYRPALVIAINFYSKSHTKEQTVIKSVQQNMITLRSQ